MKKNTLLSVIMLLFCSGLSAQQLYSEDFENFTLGNVTTSSDGQTAGQGGWFFTSNYTLGQSILQKVRLLQCYHTHYILIQ